MNRILSFTFEEYAGMVKSFHGNTAPGVMIGGFMVDLALRNLPGEGLYDVICETAKCLPDAVQLLTPCSVGNEWLRIIDVGRYALVFYEKTTGEGVRVYLDPARMGAWPEIRNWFMRLVPKKAQDKELLFRQIGEAGTEVCGIERVNVSPRFLKKEKGGPVSVCPSCNEAYPSERGTVCPACGGELLPYSSGKEKPPRPR